jgi:hypothetical protein
MSAWFESPDLATVVVQQDGKDVPIKDIPFVKETPDLATFVKRGYEAHREVGSRLPLKIDKTKPEEVIKWKTDNLPKLWEAGVLDRPLTKVEEYEIKKPENLPEGLNWSDELSGELGKTLLKHGIPKAAVPELLELHTKALTNGLKDLDSGYSYEETTAALKAEFGADYDATLEDAKRLFPQIFKSERDVAFFAKTGLGNHPILTGILMRMSKGVKADTSVMNGNNNRGTGAMTLQEAQSEHADIMNNKANPKHALYHSKDPATLQYVEDLYKKIPGSDAKVTIG